MSEAWSIDFDGPEQEALHEALTVLGNGYFATRGAVTEPRADGSRYAGTYLAGGYDRAVTAIAGHRVENEDLVNFPDWLELRWRAAGGDWLGVGEHRDVERRRTLDLRSGVLRVSRITIDGQARRTRIEKRRLVSMADPHVAALELSLTPQGWSGAVEVVSGIRHDVRNDGVARYRALEGRHLETSRAGAGRHGGVVTHVRTRQSGLEVAQCAWTEVTVVDGTTAPPTLVEEPGFVGERFRVTLAPGQSLRITKRVAVHTSRDRASAGCVDEACASPVRETGFDRLEAEHARAWQRLWRHADIVVRNETVHHQRALRLHLFHLLQTVSPHTVEIDCGVPARGWHGEAYRGHVFWDELFILPFFSLRFPDLARALLRYRHRRLPQARQAARAAGLRGALFPWQSASNGREETQALHLNPRSGRWTPDHSRLQRHVNLAIAYNVWQHYQITADLWFLRFEGGELILEIARMLASLAVHDPATGRYRIRGVVGPDEYHEGYPGVDRPGVDDNAYTNIMTAWVLGVALDVLEVLPEEARASLCERLGVDAAERAHWDDVSRRLHVPFLDNGLIAQFEGYDDLAEFDWDHYRATYGDIRRLDRILEAEGDTPDRYRLSKQADVLMLFYLLSAEDLTQTLARLGHAFDPARIPEMVAYYLARTSHGSTLSAVVHAWVLARADRTAAWSLFEEALRSDLEDSQGGTTGEGIHLGAMAATVDIVQRAWLGCSFRGGCLRLEPCLPDALDSVRLEIRYHANRLSLALTRDALVVTAGHWSRDAVHYYVRDRVFRIRPGERHRHRLGRPASSEQPGSRRPGRASGRRGADA